MWRRFIAAWWDKFANEEVGSNDLYPLAMAAEGLTWMAKRIVRCAPLSGEKTCEFA